MERNPFWEAAKWSFAVVGGGAVAGALVVGTYKAAMRLTGKVFSKVEETLDSVEKEEEENNE